MPGRIFSTGLPTQFSPDIPSILSALLFNIVTALLLSTATTALCMASSIAFSWALSRSDFLSRVITMLVLVNMPHNLPASSRTGAVPMGLAFTISLSVSKGISQETDWGGTVRKGSIASSRDAFCRRASRKLVRVKTPTSCMSSPTTGKTSIFECLKRRTAVSMVLPFLSKGTSWLIISFKIIATPECFYMINIILPHESNSFRRFI